MKQSSRVNIGCLLPGQSPRSRSSLTDQNPEVRPPFPPALPRLCPFSSLSKKPSPLPYHQRLPSPSNSRFWPV
ncbi:hypothetical protein SLE2022_297950 [Rubroshorea leprosula]